MVSLADITCDFMDDTGSAPRAEMGRRTTGAARGADGRSDDHSGKLCELLAAPSMDEWRLYHQLQIKRAARNSDVDYADRKRIFERLRDRW